MAGRSSNTLDYQIPRRPPPRKRLVRWLCYLLSAVALVYVGGSFIPFAHRRVTYICTSCGRIEEQNEWSLVDIPYWWRRTVISTDNCKIYDRLIAIPHQHAWLGYERIIEGGNLWGYGGIGEGGSDAPADVITAALAAIENNFADLPIAQRQAIYSRLQQCKTVDEVHVAVDAEVAKLGKSK